MSKRRGTETEFVCCPSPADIVRRPGTSRVAAASCIISILVSIAVSIVLTIVLFFLFSKKSSDQQNAGQRTTPVFDVQCGFRYEITSRMLVTNGSEPSLGFAPWFVSIVAFNATLDNETNQNIYICGGSIISNRWVLTAAHCLAPDIKNFCAQYCYVIAGSQKRNDTPHSYGSAHKVIKQIPFRKEDKHTNSTDIALIEVNPPFKYRAPGTVGRRAIGPVCLPEQDEEITETEGDIVGLGGTNDTIYHQIESGNKSKENFTDDEELQNPTNLVTARVDIISNEDCAKIPPERLRIVERHKQNWRKLLNPKSTICAGKLEHRKVACWGDSGSPLTVVDKKKRVTVIGVTATILTESCNSDPIWYTVYTRVSHFRNWIQQVTGI